MPTRVWVVTGTSSGLGLAIAQYVLAKGDKVIASVRTLAKFPAILRDAGAQPLILDLKHSDEEIRLAGTRAIEIYGHVDVLVNNAGTNTGVGPVEEIQINEIRKQFQDNTFGPIAFTQPFIAHFRTRRSGHILNISSVSSLTSYPSFGAYTGSKAALDAFSEALYREVAPYGIRVHIILPGYFPTNIFVGSALYSNKTPGEIAVASGLSKVYTDESQGYNMMNYLPVRSEAMGLVGDVNKLAARVWEIVTDTGIAKEIRLNQKPWIRVPMGTDCGQIVLQKLESIVENWKATEPIWRSTDVTMRSKL